MTNKDLLYSTWNSAQCYVAAWIGGWFGQNDRCIRKAESLRCLPETITALLMAMPQHKIKKVKEKTKQNTCPGPNLLMDILIGPNFKDFLAWTKYLIDVLEKMKCAMRS